MAEFGPKPRSILMIKSHSLGVGDLLRSSAAWRVMKNAWPHVQLHLLFLSKHPGYPTQDLIKRHHLLSSAHFITLREGSPQDPSKKRVKMSHILWQAQSIAKEHEVDWVIDFEMHGLRTAWLTWRLGQLPLKRHEGSVHSNEGLENHLKPRRIQTFGVNQFWPRAWFYRHSSVSLPQYSHQEGLASPMDYTHRDFVVLSALGLRRGDTPIELEASEASVLKAQSLLEQAFPPDSQTSAISPRPLWGLNIGCGTPDALAKRPRLKDLVQSVLALAQRYTFDLVLTGAPFEREINEEFIEALKEQLNEQLNNQLNEVKTDLDPSPVKPRLFNAAGTGSLSDLSGLISKCELFISTDSGPYHMAVALKVPTLVWFVIDQPASYHQVPWCERVVNPNVSVVLEAVKTLKPRAT